jgi:hypothetical protein
MFRTQVKSSGLQGPKASDSLQFGGLPQWKELMAPDPKPRLFQYIYQDFLAQLHYRDMTWQTDSYATHNGKKPVGNHFITQITVDPDKVPGFDSLKLPAHQFKKEDGTLQPVKVHVWRALNPANIQLELGSTFLQSAPDRTASTWPRRLLNLGLQAPWRTLVSPLPHSLRDYRLNQMFDTLRSLDAQGKLGRTERGNEWIGQHEKETARNLAMKELIQELLKGFKLEKEGEAVTLASRSGRRYQLPEITLPEETLKRLHLQAEKPVQVDLYEFGNSDWQLQLGETKLHSNLSLTHPFWIKVSPFHQSLRPADDPFSVLVHRVRKSPHYRPVES